LVNCEFFFALAALPQVPCGLSGALAAGQFGPPFLFNSREVIVKPLHSFTTGKGNGRRESHVPPVSGTKLVTQAPRFQDPHFPFQPLPKPNGIAPYRYDLSKLLALDDVQSIKSAGSMVFHTVGDTGDYRGQQKDFVAEMLLNDSEALPVAKKPAFFYHLGDVVYFAGDVNMYGDNFYETYKDYPGFIVAIPGNHDCQPDDPQDGPVDPNKFPLDGFVQNFMAQAPGQLGSLKTGSARTQLDLPNVYWTFTTPFATIIGLFSNVGETQGEFHQDQIDWFQGELAAADPNLALIVTVHHPPYSGDIDHSGSSVVEKTLFDSFNAAGRFPNLILSGHVHNYQRFTKTVQTNGGDLEIPCIVAGSGGYTKLGKLHKVGGAYPVAPVKLDNGLSLESYDQDNFGFLRIEVSKSKITGVYSSAPYAAGASPDPKELDSFEIDLSAHSVRTLA
jgi:acid phosphatase type 7